jgi:metacaspase-1
MAWVAVLRKMRTVLGGMGYDQVPQLTSSRMIDVDKTMYIVPPGSSGAKRAVLIGINYVGQRGQLSGCHNDAKNIKDYLENALGFRDQDMLVLLDDGTHHAPTRQNILNAFKRVAEYSKPGDVVFIHYSGESQRKGIACPSFQ